MERVEYLQDQALRAERLAGRITDTLTVERLRSFAAECRRELRLIAGTIDLVPYAAKLDQGSKTELARPI